jgi:hypothetical protein
MDFHQRYAAPERSCPQRANLMVFLYFSVLTFTPETPPGNARARVSKSRTGDPDSIFNSSDKARRICP